MCFKCSNEAFRLDSSLVHPKHTCADPEKKFWESLTLPSSFKLMRGSKYHFKRAIIGPPAKRHLKRRFAGVPINGPTLNTDWVAL